MHSKAKEWSQRLKDFRLSSKKDKIPSADIFYSLLEREDIKVKKKDCRKIIQVFSAFLFDYLYNNKPILLRAGSRYIIFKLYRMPIIDNASFYKAKKTITHYVKIGQHEYPNLYRSPLYVSMVFSKKMRIKAINRVPNPYCLSIEDPDMINHLPLGTHNVVK